MVVPLADSCWTSLK